MCRSSPGLAPVAVSSGEGDECTGPITASCTRSRAWPISPRRNSSPRSERSAGSGTKAQFAMANGTAPLPASSGRIQRTGSTGAVTVSLIRSIL